MINKQITYKSRHFMVITVFEDGYFTGSYAAHDSVPKVGRWDQAHRYEHPQFAHQELATVRESYPKAHLVLVTHHESFDLRDVPEYKPSVTMGTSVPGI